METIFVVEEGTVIFYLAPGEPSYLPDELLVPVRDQAHLDLAPLLHQFESRILAWEAAALLAASHDWWPLKTLAAGVCKSPTALLPQLWPLIENGIIQERLQITGPRYRLNADYRLRRLALLLAEDPTHAPSLTAQPDLVTHSDDHVQCA